MSDAAYRLARRLAALPEPAMRTAVLLEFVKATAPEHVADALAEVQERGRSGGPPFNVALQAVVTLLSGDSLDYPCRAEIYGAAKAAGHVTLTQLFYSGAPSELAPPRPNEQRELTLGHRKTMARQGDRAVLERLLRDPEPEVIDQLLLNTHITEEDVVRLAAQRPALAEVQRLISASARWLARYRIKRALVLNPYTPTELSIRLLGFINPADLRLIRTSPTLPERLRQAATKVAREKSGD